VKEGGTRNDFYFLPFEVELRTTFVPFPLKRIKFILGSPFLYREGG
jgi:hypothetical protein